MNSMKKYIFWLTVSFSLIGSFINTFLPELFGYKFMIIVQSLPIVVKILIQLIVLILVFLTFPYKNKEK
jgi:hypothetical protein